MIQIKLIPNWQNLYKFYVVWVAAAAAVFNWLELNQSEVQALLPPEYLPYWNIGFAIVTVIVRSIHQPAVVATAPPEKAS